MTTSTPRVEKVVSNPYFKQWFPDPGSISIKGNALLLEVIQGLSEPRYILNESVDTYKQVPADTILPNQTPAFPDDPISFNPQDLQTNCDDPLPDITDGLLRAFHPKYKYPGPAETWIGDRKVFKPHPTSYLTIAFDSIQFKTDPKQPLFASMAVYDLHSKRKVTEGFNFDLNDVSILSGPLLEQKEHADLCTLSNTAAISLTDLKQFVLIVKLESIFQGDPESFLEMYTKKTLKRQDQGSDASVSARSPFAWAALQLDLPVETGEYEMSPFYPMNGLQTRYQLMEAVRDVMEGNSSLKPIEGSKCAVRISTLKELENAVDTSLIPLASPTTSPGPIVRQLLSFRSQFEGFRNTFYIYPEKLAYYKAKNISIEISFHADSASEGVRAFFGKSSFTAFTSLASTQTIFKQKSPQWTDEVKLMLPYESSPDAHLLFKFYHLPSNGKKNRQILGFSVLKLFPDGIILANAVHRLDFYEGEPFSGYIEAAPTLGQQFYVRTRNCSSIFPTDPKIASFLSRTQLFVQLDTLDTAKYQEQAERVLKGLLEVPIKTLERFSVHLLHFLERQWMGSDVKEQPMLFVFKAVNAIVYRISSGGDRRRSPVLCEYIRQFAGDCQGKSLVPLLRLWKYELETVRDGTFTTFSSHAVDNSWFLLDLIWKNIAMLPKLFTDSSHNKQLITALRDIILITAQLIKANLSKQTKLMSTDLAIFLKDLASIAPRSIIEELATQFIDAQKPLNPQTVDLHIKFLRVLCDSASPHVSLLIAFVLDHISIPTKAVQSQLCNLVADLFCKYDWGVSKVKGDEGEFRKMFLSSAFSVDRIKQLSNCDIRKLGVSLLSCVLWTEGFDGFLDSLGTEEVHSVAELLLTVSTAFLIQNNRKQSLVWERSSANSNTSDSMRFDTTVHIKVNLLIVSILRKHRNLIHSDILRNLLLSETPQTLNAVSQLLSSYSDVSLVSQIVRNCSHSSRKIRSVSVAALFDVAVNEFDAKHSLQEFTMALSTALMQQCNETSVKCLRQCVTALSIWHSAKSTKSFAKVFGGEMEKVLDGFNVLVQLIEGRQRFDLCQELCVAQISKYPALQSGWKDKLKEILIEHKHFNELSVLLEGMARQDPMHWRVFVDTLVLAEEYQKAIDVCELEWVPVLKESGDAKTLSKVYTILSQCYDNMTRPPRPKDVFHLVSFGSVEEQFVYRLEKSAIEQLLVNYNLVTNVGSLEKNCVLIEELCAVNGKSFATADKRCFRVEHEFPCLTIRQKAIRVVKQRTLSFKFNFPFM